VPELSLKPQAAAPALTSQLPSALVIAGASAASYWLAHVYESAYLAYFGLPASLVHVSTNTTIIAAGATLSVMWGAFTAAAIVSTWFSGLGLGPDLYAVVAVMVFRGFASMYTSFRDWQSWVWNIGAAAVVVVIALVMRYVEKRRAASGQPIEPASREGTPSSPVPTTFASPAVVRLLLPWLGREGLVLCFVLFQAQGVAREAGHAAARDAAKFFTFDREGPNVVLRAYDDVLVAAPFDSQRHVVHEDVLLVPVAKQEAIGLRWESVGPLHREPRAASTSAGSATAAANAPAQGAATSRTGAAQCLSCHSA
jgi:hypothetical protein